MKPYIEAVFPRMVHAELVAATMKFDTFPTSHHAYAVILEELDEFWEVVKGSCPIKGEAREQALRELVQVAAMCWRAAMDLELIVED